MLDAYCGGNDAAGSMALPRTTVSMKLPAGLSRMPIHHLSQTRQEILVELLRRGSASVEDLAEILAFTIGAVRQQLLTLYGEGLVFHRAEPHGPGRPRHVYQLTPAGQALFRPDYSETARRLASFIAAEAPNVFARFFDAEIDRSISQFEREADDAGARQPGARMDAFVGWLDEHGYIPTIEGEGERITLKIHNCPLFDFVQAEPGLCRFMAEGMRRALPGFTIERTAWRIAGDAHCAYKVSRAAS